LTLEKFLPLLPTLEGNMALFRQQFVNAVVAKVNHQMVFTGNILNNP